MLKFMLPLLLFPLPNLWLLLSFTFILISFMNIPNFFFSMTTMNFFSNKFFLDPLNSPLIILTLWTSSLMLMASMKIYIIKNFDKEFSFIMAMLYIILILSFNVTDLMMYYITFEGSLIPTLLLILGWGYQPERLQAGMYLMLYTVTASLPLLAGLTFMQKSNSSLMFNSLFMTPSLSMYSLSIILMIAFLVKMPMYISHLWLPKAHVEAPVAGSMILAGILLKLGAYGILRVGSLFKFPLTMTSSIFIPVSLWGAFATAMICIRQQDMKSLIAYSSVGHMALLIGGMLAFSKFGWEGSVIIMIAHGLSSSALFSMANMNYESSNSRSMMLSKGFLFVFPNMTMWWFLFSAANMAAPPTLNLLGEILLLTSILQWSLMSALFLALASFLAAVYSLILYTSPHHGTVPQSMNPIFTPTPRNFIISTLHSIPLFIFILTSINISNSF